MSGHRVLVERIVLQSERKIGGKEPICLFPNGDGRYVFSVMASEGGGTKWAGEVAENRCCWSCGQY